MNNFEFANIATPTPGNSWLQLPDRERLRLVESALTANPPTRAGIIAIVDAKSDGQVIVSLREPVPADQRGTLLLDLEASLKESIDPALVVWLEPLGDKSSLRNLRGIEVKV